MRKGANNKVFSGIDLDGLSEKDNKGKETVQVGNRGCSSAKPGSLRLSWNSASLLNIESLYVPMNIHIESLCTSLFIICL